MSLCLTGLGKKLNFISSLPKSQNHGALPMIRAKQGRLILEPLLASLLCRGAANMLPSSSWVRWSPKSLHACSTPWAVSGAHSLPLPVLESQRQRRRYTAQTSSWGPCSALSPFIKLAKASRVTATPAPSRLLCLPLPAPFELLKPRARRAASSSLLSMEPPPSASKRENIACICGQRSGVTLCEKTRIFEKTFAAGVGGQLC